MIRRDGAAFEADQTSILTGLTDYGAAVSLCAKVPLTNLISVRLRAEDYIYRSQLRSVDPGGGETDLNFNSRLQNDLVFSAGLQMVFWR